MNNRYIIAHIIIEADSPLKVGSNASDFLQDSPVQKDWNDLPMILGTSIAGILRKDFIGNDDEVFGNKNGSKVIFSNALLCIDNKNIVCQKLLLDKDRTEIIKLFDNLPIREHTAITDKGVAKDNSKFDEELVYKGTRFKFSIEVLEDKKAFEEIINLLQSSSFRLGGGSTKGFGKFKIKEIRTQTFDKDSYVDYSSSLNHTLSEAKAPHPIEDTNYIKYTLNITPDDFFMFGSGFGDSDADNTPVYEKVVDYQNAKLSNKQILIPASSIKGALSHRTAFYYNKSQKIYSDNLSKEETLNYIGENNLAVSIIFGASKSHQNERKGRILISDCFREDKKDIKTFDHVAIDRFTGGAIEGALFQEKTIAQKDKWEIEILLENKDIEERYIKAFEAALKDVCSGMLPLGGMTTKGHGVFSGIVLKDGNEL